MRDWTIRWRTRPSSLQVLTTEEFIEVSELAGAIAHYWTPHEALLLRLVTAVLVELSEDREQK